MGTDSVIYIRTDGNSNIATGHLVRCLCIAQALESLGKDVCFLVSDNDSFTLLHDLATSIFEEYTFSFDVKILETAVYNNLELELEELKKLLNLENNSFKQLLEVSHSLDKQLLNQHKLAQSENSSLIKPIIFIDSYFVTETYFSSLKEFAHIAYMDDLRAFDYNVDLVVNYDVIPPAMETEYKQAYTNAAITLLGAEYTPLRDQFQNQKIALRNEIKNILITTGGSDPYNFAPTLASYLLSLNLELEIHVVVGRLFKDTKNLEELAKQNSSLHLHYNVSDMASLMKQCDYAVSAAGTTLYELCALGIPSISISMADNQIPMAETFADVDAVPYAGDIRVSTTLELEIVLHRIFDSLVTLQENMDNYVKQQNNMHCLVDGNGAIKIAEELCKL